MSSKNFKLNPASVPYHQQVRDNANQPSPGQQQNPHTFGMPQQPVRMNPPVPTGPRNPHTFGIPYQPARMNPSPPTGPRNPHAFGNPHHPARINPSPPAGPRNFHALGMPHQPAHVNRFPPVGPRDPTTPGWPQQPPRTSLPAQAVAGSTSTPNEMPDNVTTPAQDVAKSIVTQSKAPAKPEEVAVELTQQPEGPFDTLNIEDLRGLLTNALESRRAAEAKLEQCQADNAKALKLRDEDLLRHQVAASHDLAKAQRETSNAVTRAEKSEKKLNDAIASEDDKATWRRKIQRQKEDFASQKECARRKNEFLEGQNASRGETIRKLKETLADERKIHHDRILDMENERNDTYINSDKDKDEVALIVAEVNNNLRATEIDLERQREHERDLMKQLNERNEEIARLYEENRTLRTLLSCNDLETKPGRREVEYGRASDHNEGLRALLSAQLSENQLSKERIQETKKEIVRANNQNEEVRIRATMLELRRMYSHNHQPRSNLGHIYFFADQVRGFAVTQCSTKFDSDKVERIVVSSAPPAISRRSTKWKMGHVFFMLFLGMSLLSMPSWVDPHTVAYPSGVGILQDVSQGQGTTTLAGDLAVTQLKGLMAPVCIDRESSTLADYPPGTPKKVPSMGSIARLRSIMAPECGSYHNLGPDVDVPGGGCGLRIACLFGKVWGGLRGMLS